MAALIVVDMQKCFSEAGEKCLAGAETLVKKAKQNKMTICVANRSR